MANFIEHVTALDFIYSAFVRHEARSAHAEPVAISPEAIGMAVALDAVYVALDRAARITQAVEQPPSLSQLDAEGAVGSLGALQTVLEGGAEQPVSQVLIHTSESAPADAASVSPKRCNT